MSFKSILTKLINIGFPIVILGILIASIVLLIGTKGTINISERDKIDNICVILVGISIFFLVIHFFINFFMYWRKGCSPIIPTIN